MRIIRCRCADRGSGKRKELKGESQLKGQESKLNSEKRNSTNKKLADAQVKLSQAQAAKAYEANLIA